MGMDYRVWMRWRITHTFYKGGICRGMELVPGAESRVLLRQRGLLWERRGWNEWCVLGLEEPPGEDDRISLQLEVTDSRLYRVTEEDIGQDYCYPLDCRGETRVLEFTGRCLYWEYILVPRVKREGAAPELVDLAGLIGFTKAGPWQFMGREAFRTVSDRPVDCCEVYGVELRLYGQKPQGRQLLCVQVPFPQAGVFVDAAPGCIRQVLYF